MSLSLLKKLHLGVNTLFFVPGDVGGTETYLREMLLAITQGYPEMSLTLFTNLENDVVLRKILADHAHVSYVCLGFRAAVRPLRILIEQVLLPLAVLRSSVTMLWSPGYTAPFWAGCPQAVTVHDLQYKQHPEDLSWLERRTLDVLVRTACRRCEAVITVSQFSRNEIVDYDFASPEKVHVVIEGVDQSFGVPVTEGSALQDLKNTLSLDNPYILCVAHTYPHKNVHLLVDAFAKIYDLIPHNLVIVGKARLGEPAMREAVSRLPVKSRLYRFENGVSFETLRLLYQKADMFVLPSTYEGFGLPVLVAMIAGVPVITVNKASLPEVGGRHALYVDDPSAETLSRKVLALIHANTSEKQENVDAAKKWATSFSWQKAAHEIIEIFVSTGDRN